MSIDVNTNGDAKPTFEAAMKEVDGIVTRLEKGDLPLDDALSAFQRGIELTRICGQLLDDVEKRVEILITSESGQATLRPLETA